MPRLMICRNLLFLLGNNPALLLCANPHLHKCMADILLCNIYPVFLCSQNCRFIQKIFQICSGKSGRRLRNLLKIYIITQRFPLGMDFQDFFSSLYIRPAHRNLPVKTSRTKNGRIKNIHTVRRRHHDDAFIHTKTIHLNKKLVQRLLSLIMAATHSGASASCHCVNFINKNNTRSILFRFLEQISHPGSTYTNKHLHKIRTGNGKERHARLSGYCLGKQCFTGSRRAYQKDSLRDSCPYLNIFLRRLQEIYDLFQLFLFLMQPGHLVKSHFLIILRGEPCTAFPEVHRLSVGAAALPVHHKENQENPCKHKKRRDNRRSKPIILRHIRHFILYALLLQILLNFIHIRYIKTADASVFYVLLYFNIHSSRRHTLVLYHQNIRRLAILNQRTELFVADFLFSLIDLIRKPQDSKQGNDK